MRWLMAEKKVLDFKPTWSIIHLLATFIARLFKPITPGHSHEAVDGGVRPLEQYWQTSHLMMR